MPACSQTRVTSAPTAMSNGDMAAVFAQKSALRKSMLKTLRGLSEAELASQCELRLADKQLTLQPLLSPGSCANSRSTTRRRPCAAT